MSNKLLYAKDRAVIAEPLTDILSGWAHELAYEDLPDEVVAAVKRTCLDFVMIALAGASGRGVGDSSTGGLGPVLAFARSHPGEATVIGAESDALPQYAALANGAFAHALNLMDVHRWSAPTHLGPTVYGAAFAAAQMTRVGFEAFAVGVAAGFEAIGKLGMALNPGHGVVDSTQANSVGAALQTAKLLGLSRGQMADSLGIATFMACGGTVSLELLSPGYWCRPLLSGWQASVGVSAAMLSAEGLRGSPRIIEAPYGFLNAESVDPAPEVLHQLGAPFEVTRTGLKVYPTTRYLHAEIEAILGLAAEHDLAPEAATEILVEKPRALYEVTASEDRRDPRVAEVARLSTYYIVAAALARRGLWLDALEPQALDDPQIRATMAKVVCRPDAALDALFPEALGARVTVQLSDGRRLSKEVLYPKGEPERPLGDAELMVKYEALYDYCLAESMPRARFDEIIGRTLALEDEPDIGEYFRLTSASP